MLGNTMVALVTPMLQDGEIDYPALQRLLDFHLAVETEAVVILGSTGEGWAISDKVRLQMAGTVVDYLRGRIPVIVGVGSNSTRTTIAAARQLQTLNIDGFLTVCPYYNKPTQEGIYLHFSRLADAVKKPIILYNHPGRTGIDMLPETVARLALHPNIAALKETVVDPQRLAALAKIITDDFILYSGDDANCLTLIQAGGKGVISVAANIIPKQMRSMVQAMLDGDVATAEDLHRSLEPLFTVLNIESNPIPLKWALAQMGYIKDVLASPLTILTAQNQPKLSEALLNAGLIKGQT